MRMMGEEEEGMKRAERRRDGKRSEGRGEMEGG